MFKIDYFIITLIIVLITSIVLFLKNLQTLTNYQENFNSCSTKTACPIGTYNNMTGSSGATACLSCQTGYYNDKTGQSACSSCPIGTYNSNYGSTSGTACLSCQPGTYNSMIGQGICSSCPTGTYNSNYGSTGIASCLSCKPGTYNNIIGQSSCSSCPMGTYNTNTGSNSGIYCSSCPTGTYNSMTGSTGIAACLSCPTGTYNDIIGQSVCRQCSTGYTSIPGSTSSSSCYTCPTGTNITSNGICNPVFTGANAINVTLTASSGSTLPGYFFSPTSGLAIMNSKLITWPSSTNTIISTFVPVNITIYSANGATFFKGIGTFTNNTTDYRLSFVTSSFFTANSNYVFNITT